jgi:hypothetical protein
MIHFIYKWLKKPVFLPEPDGTEERERAACDEDLARDLLVVLADSPV